MPAKKNSKTAKTPVKAKVKADPQHPYGKGDLSWYQDARFGMFIHWGLYALPARHEWVRHNECISDEDYQKYFDHFNPDMFNPKEWARAAKEAGMKYFVVTSKHHEGFCLFDSKYTDYKATNTPCGRDLLREIIDAFRAEGIRIGLYYSLLDWHHPQNLIDGCIGPYRLKSEEERKKMNKGRNQHLYAEYMRNQVTELLTNYGKIDIIWFDFSYPCQDDPSDGTRGKGRIQWESEKLIKLVRKLQPDIIVDDRLDLPGSGDFVSPEQFTPDQGMTDADGNPVPWEGCQTLSGSWGYHRDELTWKSAEQCLRVLIDHVSRDGNLIMNVGPTARGYFDYRAMERLKDYADWMKYNSRSIYGCGSAPGLEAPLDCRYTYNRKTNRLYLHMYAWPFNHLTLKGLEGKVAYMQFLHDGSEVTWRENQGQSCGNAAVKSGDVALRLPTIQPPLKVVTIEIFLKKPLD